MEGGGNAHANQQPQPRDLTPELPHRVLRGSDPGGEKGGTRKASAEDWVKCTKSCQSVVQARQKTEWSRVTGVESAAETISIQ